MPIKLTKKQQKELKEFTESKKNVGKSGIQDKGNVFNMAIEMLGAPSTIKDDPVKCREFLDSFYFEGKPYSEYLTDTVGLGKVELEKNPASYLAELMKTAAESGKSDPNHTPGILFRNIGGQMTEVISVPEKPGAAKRFAHLSGAYKDTFAEYEKQMEDLTERINQGRQEIKNNGTDELSQETLNLSQWAKTNAAGLPPIYQDRIQDALRILKERDDSMSNVKMPTLAPNKDAEFLQQMLEINKSTASKQKLALDLVTDNAITIREAAEKEGNSDVKERMLGLSAQMSVLGTHLQAQMDKMNEIYDQTFEAYNKKGDRRQYREKFAGKDYRDVLLDSTITRPVLNLSEGKIFGSGGINTVYKLDGKIVKPAKVHVSGYDSDGTENYVFDKRLEHDDKESFFSFMEARPEEEDRLNFVNTANRDVAVSRVNDLLGLGVSVHTKMAMTPEGRPLTVMDMAQGVSASKLNMCKGNLDRSDVDLSRMPFGSERYKELRGRVLEYDKDKMDLGHPEVLLELGITPEVMNVPENRELIRTALSTDKLLNSQQIHFERIKNQNTPERREAFVKLNMLQDRWKSLNDSSMDFDIQNQDYVKKMMNLSALDIITGHRDRHLGNYMVQRNADGTVAITAIDNDTSFGLDENSSIKPDHDMADGSYATLEAGFRFVTKEVKDKIDEISPDDLQGALAGLLTKEQVDKSCERLEQMKEHFAQLEREGKVVTGNFTKRQIEEIYEWDEKNIGDLAKAQEVDRKSLFFDVSVQSIETQEWRDLVHANDLERQAERIVAQKAAEQAARVSNQKEEKDFVNQEKEEQKQNPGRARSKSTPDPVKESTAWKPATREEIKADAALKSAAGIGSHRVKVSAKDLGTPAPTADKKDKAQQRERANSLSKEAMEKVNSKDKKISIEL